MSDPLATLPQLERFLGRPLTADEALRADDLIVYASATVRAYTGQTITQETTTQRLRVRCGQVLLPQAPVSSITSVMTVWGTPTAVPYAWDGGQILYVGASWLDRFDVEPLFVGQPVKVDVEYEHGYETIPEAVTSVVLQIVTRALGRHPEDGGITQEAIDGYSYQIGSTAAAGPTGLLPAESAVLDALRGPRVPISVLGTL